MKYSRYWFVVSLLALTIGAAGSVARGDDASSIPLGAPPPNPITLWNFLGIPQGINQLRDATSNRLGNNPDSERQVPLKRIADPDNMQSKNPAIAAAAKIKAEQDQAQQKIKAIKFLAQTGCCCPANKDIVKDALLASLDDCTEAVRYEAAKALCAVAGACATCSTCPGQVNCPRCTCCTADVMNKLNDMANGTTAEGCPIEPSLRVRCAAANALEQCRRARSPTTQVAPEEVKKPEPKPEAPLERRAPQAPKPETRKETPRMPAAPAGPQAPPVFKTPVTYATPEAPQQPVESGMSPYVAAPAGMQQPEPQPQAQWQPPMQPSLPAPAGMPATAAPLAPYVGGPANDSYGPPSGMAPNDSPPPAQFTAPVSEQPMIEQAAPTASPNGPEPREPVQSVLPDSPPKPTTDIRDSEAYIQSSDRPQNPVTSPSNIPLTITLTEHNEVIPQPAQAAAVVTAAPAAKLQAFLGQELDVSAQPIIGPQRPVVAQSPTLLSVQPQRSGLQQPTMSWLGGNYR